MKIEIWPQYGPLNSKDIFKKFINSLENNNEQLFVNQETDADVAVIWSVLWSGRMSGYRPIWNRYTNKNKAVVVIEVGGIKRNETFKIAINGINREADFANQQFDDDRWKKFNISLRPWKQTGDNIIICGQHSNSHQWRNNPPMTKWIEEQIQKIREHTEKPIVIRPHPRHRVAIDTTKFRNVKIIGPKRDHNTYDDTDLNKAFENAWTVINHSSNPAIQAVFNGIPVFVSESSLCYDIGNSDYKDIENPVMPDRQNWCNQLSYTEWFPDEIEQGIPWQRIKKRLEEKYV